MGMRLDPGVSAALPADRAFSRTVADCTERSLPRCRARRSVLRAGLDVDYTGHLLQQPDPGKMADHLRVEPDGVGRGRLPLGAAGKGTAGLDDDDRFCDDRA